MSRIDVETQLRQARLQKYGVLVQERAGGSIKVFTPEYVEFAHLTMYRPDISERVREVEATYGLTGKDLQHGTSVFLLVMWAKEKGIDLGEDRDEIVELARLITGLRRLVADAVRAQERARSYGGTFLQ